MKTTTEIIAMVNALAFAASSEDAPTGWWTAISIDDLRAAANRLAELERENARLREALFQTHLDLVAYADIDVARKRLVERRVALAGSGER